MQLPNKVISYNESVLSKFPIILDLLQQSDYTVAELFALVKNKMDIEDFIDTLDCLYALGKVNLNKTTRRLCYVI